MSLFEPRREASMNPHLNHPHLEITHRAGDHKRDQHPLSFEIVTDIETLTIAILITIHQKSGITIKLNSPETDIILTSFRTIHAFSEDGRIDTLTLIWLKHE